MSPVQSKHVHLLNIHIPPAPIHLIPPHHHLHTHTPYQQAQGPSIPLPASRYKPTRHSHNQHPPTAPTNNSTMHHTASSPVRIPSSASSSSSSSSFFSSASSPSDMSSSPKGYSCAYPSWPTGNSFGSGSYRNNTPSSYISDADLFPDDLLDSAPILEEAPAPPRVPPMPEPVQMPLLPLYASPKKRRSSSKKQRRPSKPMTPIAESPAKAPE